MLSPRRELEVIKAVTYRQRNQVTKRKARKALGCLPQVRMRRGIEIRRRSMVVQLTLETQVKQCPSHGNLAGRQTAGLSVRCCRIRAHSRACGSSLS
jgi:hypothetical protein